MICNYDPIALLSGDFLIITNINIQEEIGDMIEDETLTNEPKNKAPKQQQ